MLPPLGAGPATLLRTVVLGYGGVDVVIDATTSAGVAHAALPVLARQGRPSSLVRYGHITDLDGLAEAAAGMTGLEVAVNAVASASPEALARATALFATGSWNRTAMTPCPHAGDQEEIA